MGNTVKALETLTGFDPVTLRIAVVAIPTALVAVVGMLAHVVRKALANAKCLRIKHRGGELVIQYQDLDDA